MKKQLPMPVVVGAIAFVAVLVVLFAWRTMSGPAEFPKAPIKAGKDVIPAYINNLSPEQRKMAEQQAKEYGVQQGTGEAPKGPPPGVGK